MKPAEHPDNADFVNNLDRVNAITEKQPGFVWRLTGKVHLVLWWVEAGHVPSLDEAKDKLNTLIANGPGESAFTFRRPYPAPGGESVPPVLDECA